MSTPSETAAYDPGQCTACRGTGRVRSSLGGEPHDVICPWCDGTGRFDPDHDAQAASGAERRGVGSDGGARSTTAASG